MDNEFPIKIDGKEFMLKPTWGVLSSIENALDTSVMELTHSIIESRVRMTELVNIIHLAIKGQDGAPNLNAIGEDVAENGMPDYMIPVGQFLSCSFSGSKEYSEGSEEKN